MKLRIRSVEYLTMLKKDHTYAELTQMTGLPATVLNRYIMGKVLPSEERAQELIAIYRRSFSLEQNIKKRITFDPEGYFDNSSILYDTLLLKDIASSVLELFPDTDIVLTSETDGIPIACAIAFTLGVDAIYARKHREVGITNYIEQTYVPSSSGKLMSLYLPQNALGKNQKVLIVDDVLRSGETQKALINLAERSGARVYGLFVIISVGDGGLSGETVHSMVTY